MSTFTKKTLLEVLTKDKVFIILEQGEHQTAKNLTIKKSVAKEEARLQRFLGESSKLRLSGITSILLSFFLKLSKIATEVFTFYPFYFCFYYKDCYKDCDLCLF